MALEHTTKRWVLLLDADEALSPALQQEMRTLLQAPLTSRWLYPTASGADVLAHESSAYSPEPFFAAVR